MSQSTSSHIGPPRHPYVERALALAREWCRGNIIDDAPALRHAVRVAVTLVRHVPDAPPELVAAALLHDSPLFAPEAPSLDLVLQGVGKGVGPIVRVLAAEHANMDAGRPPRLDDLPVLQASGADKIVAFRSLVRRARKSGDEQAFWARRKALRDLLPYFHEWCQLACPLLPQSMVNDLEAALRELTVAAVPAGSLAVRRP